MDCVSKVALLVVGFWSVVVLTTSIMLLTGMSHGSQESFDSIKRQILANEGCVDVKRCL